MQHSEKGVNIIRTQINILRDENNIVTLAPDA